MTGNKCLLDTCVIVHSFKKANNVAEKLDALEEIYVSATVVGELYYGAYKLGNPVKKLHKYRRFWQTAKYYAWTQLPPKYMEQ